MTVKELQHEELDLLRNIAEAAFDYSLGTSDKKFSDLNGGQDSLLNAMEAKLKDYHQFLEDNQTE